MGGFLTVSTKISGSVSSPGIPVLGTTGSGLFKTTADGIGASLAGLQYLALDQDGFSLGYRPTEAISLALAAVSPVALTVADNKFALSPNGSMLVNSTATGASVYQVNPATGGMSLISSVVFAASAPIKIEFSPDGSFVYIANANNSILLCYSVNYGSFTLTSVGTVAIFSTTQDFKISPDGKFVYYTYYNGVTTAGFVVHSRNTTTGIISAAAVQSIASTNAYKRIAVTTNGFYAVGSTTGNLEQFARSSTTGLITAVGSTIVIGGNVADIIESADGSFIYVLRSTNTIYGYSVAASGLLTALSGSPYASGGQFGIASADNLYIFTQTSAGALAALSRNISTGVLTPISSLTVGATYVNGIELSPDNLFVFSLDSATSRVGVTQTATQLTYPLLRGYFDPLGIAGVFNINGTLTLRGQPTLTNPLTTTGDMLYASSGNTPARAAGNITTTQKFLSQTGDGTTAGAPSWQPAPVGGFFVYYFQNTASDVATYLAALSTPYTPSTPLTTAGIVNAQVLRNFISALNNPSMAFIPEGRYDVNIHTLQSAGTKVTALYAEIWETTSAGVDIALIGTTGNTGTLSALNQDLYCTLSLATPYTLASTASRIDVRIRASCPGSGSAPTVSVYVGGVDDSRVSFPSVQVDATSFVPYVGATKPVGLLAGTVALPALYLSTDTSTGLYRIAANNYGFAVSGVKVLDIASTGLTVTGAISASGNITNQTSVVGSSLYLTVINTDNTNAASGSYLEAYVGGASAGDPFYKYTISGVLNWVHGVDNSDSDAWVLSRSANIGSSNILRADAAGLTVTGTVIATAYAKAAIFNTVTSVTASIATGTPTTIFSVASAVGMFSIFAYITDAGAANYTAFATVLCDNTNARLVIGSNGALLTITLSGTNVQVTQSSGSNQAVTYAYTRVA